MKRTHPQRGQKKLIPDLVDSRIPLNHAARFFILIAQILEITLYQTKKKGRTGYHRPTVVALVLYALFDGKTSSEQIQEFARMNLGAIYIVGNMDIPSTRTIENVKNEILNDIDSIHEQVLCIINSIGLIGKKRVFIDGKKSKANASKHKAMSYKYLNEKIDKEEANIAELINDVIALMEDFDEIEMEGLVDLIIEEGELIYRQNESLKKEDLKEKQNQLFGGVNNEDTTPVVSVAAMESKVVWLIDEVNKDKALELLDKIGFIYTRLNTMIESKAYLEDRWRKKNGNKAIPDDQQVNFTDPDSSIMVTKHQGVQQCYNHFAVVDQKANIILGVTTSNSSNDKEGFIPAFEHTKELLGTMRGLPNGLWGLEAGGDAGFFSAEIINYGIENGMDLYLSFPQPEGKYAKDKFKYNQEENYYTCPGGQRLIPGQKRKETAKIVCYKTEACATCPSQKDCTKAKDGIRKIQRHLQDDLLREEAIKKASTEKGKMMLKVRKSVPEPVWGNMVLNDALAQMHYRGMLKVSKEFMLRCVTHNLRKLRKAFSSNVKTQQMIEKLAEEMKAV